MEPNIPENSRAAPICSSRSMSSLFGLLKYSFPNMVKRPDTIGRDIGDDISYSSTSTGVSGLEDDE